MGREGMGTGVGGGLVGGVVGSDAAVLVGGGVAVTAMGVGAAPPDGDRQAVRETMSNIKIMVFLCIVPFPYHMSVRATVIWRRGNLLMPKTLRFLWDCFVTPCLATPPSYGGAMTS